MQIEMAQYILPFLAAVIGIVVLLAHASQHLEGIKRGDPGTILLILVSLLCTAYGVERLTYSEQFAERLDRIDQALQRNVSAEFIDDTRDIWRGIDELMTSMEHDIRTVQSGDRRNKIPDEFKSLEYRVADRLAEMKQRHPDVKYRIVLVFDGKKSGKELGLGFDTSSDTNNVEIQNAMQWRNQKELAHKFARWSDETIWKRAVPFEAWLIEQKEKAGSPAPVVGCSNL